MAIRPPRPGARALTARRTTVALALLGLAACKSDVSPSSETTKTSALEPAKAERPKASRGPAAAQLLEDPGDPDSSPVTRAVAVLTPTKGHQVSGRVSFTEGENGVEVEAEVEGLPPGKHAYHLHLFGDCSSDDGKSAGTHLNLEGSSKTPPKDIRRITGNLGELEADDSGKATGSQRLPKATLSRPGTLIGRSVIVHEKGNDESAPPIGAAGGRLACGVIGVRES